MTRNWRAGGLSSRQSAPEKTAAARAHQAAVARTLGPTPGQNFIYVHLNRVINRYDLNMIYISGPVRRRPGLSRQHLSRRHLQRNLSERQPERSGLEEVVQAVLFPGGIPGHVAPETPGSVHEASELGYSLSHDTFGAVSGNPDLIVACVIGDGQAETGPLATACINHPTRSTRPRFIGRCARSRA